MPRAHLGRVAECVQEREDVASEVRLLDERIWPDRLDELILRDKLAASSDKDQQNLERLGRQRNQVAVAKDDLPSGVHAEWAELVELGVLLTCSVSGSAGLSR